ncbi:unnamed protein product [Heligmosomoides polygyrus]|uniref:Uncharacterized protein n=1 Tax=Heligmosomoides polygyrus TaxID=6339 RepID=A0A183GVH4_HELPZ|nr:unnamed protein product [Heligmosomoides polygyrus]
MADEVEEIPFAPLAAGEEECVMRGAEAEESRTSQTERLQEDGNVVRVKALAQLQKLNMRPDQTVEEFCVVLKKFVGKAYPDTPPEASDGRNTLYAVSALAR